LLALKRVPQSNSNPDPSVSGARTRTGNGGLKYLADMAVEDEKHCTKTV
jgi:hypothetical protein